MIAETPQQHRRSIRLSPALTMTLLSYMGDPPTAAEIHAFREKWGLTQAELARRLGLRSGVVTISAWENGRSTPQSYLRLALVELAREMELERQMKARGVQPAEIEGEMQSEIRRLEGLLYEDGNGKG